MKEFYNSNRDFKEYVDKYRIKHKITTEQALEHILVKDVGKQYEKYSRRIKQREGDEL